MLEKSFINTNKDFQGKLESHQYSRGASGDIIDCKTQYKDANSSISVSTTTDINGKVKSVNNNGFTATTEYDNLGNKTRDVDFNGFETKYYYNDMGKLLEVYKQIEKTGDKIYSYSKLDYDVNNNWASKTEYSTLVAENTKPDVKDINFIVTTVETTPNNKEQTTSITYGGKTDKYLTKYIKYDADGNISDEYNLDGELYAGKTAEDIIKAPLKIQKHIVNTYDLSNRIKTSTINGTAMVNAENSGRCIIRK